MAMPIFKSKKLQPYYVPRREIQIYFVNDSNDYHMNTGDSWKENAAVPKLKIYCIE